MDDSYLNPYDPIGSITVALESLLVEQLKPVLDSMGVSG